MVLSMSITGHCPRLDSVLYRNEDAEMFFKTREQKQIEEVEKLDKEFLTMKEVREYLPFSRSRCYELKDEGVLECVQEGTLSQPRFKYLTRSVLKILQAMEKHEADPEELRRKEKMKKKRTKDIDRLRRRLYES